MPLRDPEARKAYDKQRWPKRRDRQNELKRISRLKNPEKYREIDKKRWTGMRRYQSNKSRRERGKIQREAIKIEVLNHYSKQTVGCAFCGEQEIEFLTIDHIEGRSDALHPKNLHGDHLYFWLKKNNFKEKCQVLCFNCNSAKEYMQNIHNLSLKPNNISERDRRKKLKIEVFTYYSKGTPRCACCGITQINFLTIDHITGRKSFGHDNKMKGNILYKSLKKSNYPVGYQVLCWNCNFSKDAKKEFKGICLHERDKIT